MAFKALLTTILFASSALSKPLGTAQAVAARSDSSTWWAANIARNGDAPYAASGYSVFRNVVEYGADNTGVQDATAAINAAIADGSRCGDGCDSTTTTPAFVYFPPGEYLISTPIVQLYYTQLVGDAVDPPTLKATSGFSGMAMIDADPYTSTGANWYTNQNNFYRQIRNFIIDTTNVATTSSATGIHWQIAQATSLQNIVFNMAEGSSSAHQGIFMDNGSGGFMTDLVFNGGKYGAFLGSQQFTSRNMTFNNCQTAIYMNWNWGWTMSGITINNAAIGFDMSSSNVGSVALLDSSINNTPIGIKTAFTTSPVSSPLTGGTLRVDNVDFSGTPIAISDTSGDEILAGDCTISAWGQGRLYSGTGSGSRVQETLTGASKASALLDSDGAFFAMSKPQYTDTPASDFVSIKTTYGAVGNGATDDTAAFQKAMAGVSTSQVLFIDYGVYLISDTVTIPANIKIVGEHWANILCTGSNFADMDSPIPCLQVGTSGESGSVQIQDLVIGTQGPAPGAILMQWNLASSQGESGLWDVHMRVGGFTGSEMQSSTCMYSTDAYKADSACVGSFLLFQATSSASGVYLENNWMWVADHELDLSDHSKVNIYNGRGILIQSDGPTWLWGTAAEHSTLYNYQLSGATNVFMGFIQTESPYFQGNPTAIHPFTPQTAWNDPQFAGCKTNIHKCIKSWGLRVLGSTNVYVYGTGLYSWFNNYNETCVSTGHCQRNMIQVQGGSSAVNMYTVTTIASTNMINYNGAAVVKGTDNLDVYGDTILGWST